MSWTIPGSVEVSLDGKSFDSKGTDINFLWISHFVFSCQSRHNLGLGVHSTCHRRLCFCFYGESFTLQNCSSSRHLT